jgi:protein TonB
MQAADRRLLAAAVGISVLVHVVLLSLRFEAPPSMRGKPLASGLDVVLVNAHSASAPLKADTLAQANLDGGGNAEAGRLRSPLPKQARQLDGALLAQQRMAALEAQQKRLLALLARQKAAALPNGERMPTPQSSGREMRSVEEIQQMARREAEIAQQVADYQKRPIKSQLTPSAREASYALYYTALQRKIEQTGTLHFPQQDGKKTYGELIVYIPVYQDGSVYEREGGPRIEVSSGIAALDAAALAIVRRAAPFGTFPPRLLGDGREHVWEIITRFSFTQDQVLETRSIRSPE